MWNLFQVDFKLVKRFWYSKDETQYWYPRRFWHLFFYAHPNDIGEGYFEHSRQSLYLAGTSFVSTIIFTVHAFCPILFTNTGTEIMEKNMERTKARKNKKKFMHPNVKSPLQLAKQQPEVLQEVLPNPNRTPTITPASSYDRLDLLDVLHESEKQPLTVS